VTLMGQPKSDDVGTPIYDQLAQEWWPPDERPELPSDDPVIQQP
jgi:hypothetical protein